MSAAVPAVVVTGFLGTGKTTMVQHLLRNRGNLRLAVLVNEVGQVDLDSQLVNLQQVRLQWMPHACSVTPCGYHTSIKASSTPATLDAVLARTGHKDATTQPCAALLDMCTCSRMHTRRQPVQHARSVRDGDHRDSSRGYQQLTCTARRATPQWACRPSTYQEAAPAAPCMATLWRR
jgi:hypothetical protein